MFHFEILALTIRETFIGPPVSHIFFYKMWSDRRVDRALAQERQTAAAEALIRFFVSRADHVLLL